MLYRCYLIKKKLSCINVYPVKLRLGFRILNSSTKDYHLTIACFVLNKDCSSSKLFFFSKLGWLGGLASSIEIAYIFFSFEKLSIYHLRSFYFFSSKL